MISRIVLLQRVNCRVYYGLLADFRCTGIQIDAQKTPSMPAVRDFSDLHRKCVNVGFCLFNISRENC
jgi:hypothetical protein